MAAAAATDGGDAPLNRGDSEVATAKSSAQREEDERARREHEALARQHGFEMHRADLAEIMEVKDVKELEEKWGGVAGVARRIKANLDVGLDDAAVTSSRSVYGDNVLPHKDPKSFLVHLIESLNDLTLIILILAAVITILFGIFLSEETEDIVQGGAILLAVVVVSGVTSVVNYIQDAKFDELSRSIEDRSVQVRRQLPNGTSEVIDVSIHDVVVGDILRVSTGEVLPCDGLFVKGSGVVTDESAMTGEPKQIHKGRTKPFMLGGSKVEGGAGEMLVITVGAETSYGKIVKALQEEEPPPTPLQTKLDDLAQKIGYLGIAFGLATIIALVVSYYAVDRNRDNAASDLVGFLVVGITIVVVAVPEGLPLAVTISLSFSMQSMTQDQNLVRELAACETMGSATCICSDKTGTLTTNRMTVVAGYFFGHFHSPATANPSAVGEEIQSSLPSRERLGTEESDNAGILARSIALNSDASVVQPDDPHAQLEYVGNKSECAMIKMVFKDYGVDYKRVREEAGDFAFRENFSSARKRMTTVYPIFAGDTAPSAAKMQAVKRAVDAVPIEQLTAQAQHAERVALASARSFRVVNGDQDEDDVHAAGMAVMAAAAEVDGEDSPAVAGAGGKSPVAPLQRPRRLPAECEDPVSYVVYCKGASEILLELCSSYRTVDGEDVDITPDVRQQLEGNIDQMASSGLRTLCVCQRIIPAEQAPAPLAVEGETRELAWSTALDQVEDKLTLVSIVGIKDPTRPEVPPAVARCKEAGVRVRMVTGDNLKTARFIAQECGIIDADHTLCMEGRDFRRMAREDRSGWLSMLPNLAVLARSSPTDKLLLVNGLKELGEIVSVTGDGTNDAPALRAAHVGLSMGIAGTEVAKEASKIVILDDNFASCVSAIKWGRSVMENIKKFLVFQLTINIVALMLTFVVSCVNGAKKPDEVQDVYINGTLSNVTESVAQSIEFPITPVQLLWVNLIMDSFAALALATEPPSPHLLKLKPAGKETPLVTKIMYKYMLVHSLWQTGLMLFLTLSDAGNHIFLEDTNASVAHYTCIFNTFVWLQLFNKLNARKIHDEVNIMEGFFESHLALLMIAIIIIMQVIIVELGGDLMSTTNLSVGQWFICIGIGATSIPVGYVTRFIPYFDEDDTLAAEFGIHAERLRSIRKTRSTAAAGGAGAAVSVELSGRQGAGGAAAASAAAHPSADPMATGATGGTVDIETGN